MATLPYMRQLPQDFYTKNLPPPFVVPVVPIPETPYPPVVSPPIVPTDPINEGGIWIGTIYPDNPGDGWLFFNTSNNNLYIYTDGAWEVVAHPSTGGIPEAPTDGGIYARQNSAWISTYDGGIY